MGIVSSTSDRHQMRAHLQDLSGYRLLILAGGYGSRMSSGDLAPLPKPMEQIGGLPILWHIMKGFSAQGIRKFTVLAGFRSGVIREYFSAGPRPPKLARYGRDPVSGKWAALHESHFDDDETTWEVDVFDSGPGTGSGKRASDGMSLALSNGEKGPFLLTYGDGLSNIDVRSLISRHERGGVAATVSLHRPKSRFGEVVLDGSLVTEFTEKGTSANLVNIGFMVLEASTGSLLAQSDGLEQDFLPSLAKNRSLGSFVHEGFWMPIDTRKELAMAQELWETGQPPWTAGLNVHA
jgi:glucose-1-phosphate cytidylyltransferase